MPHDLGFGHKIAHLMVKVKFYIRSDLVEKVRSFLLVISQGESMRLGIRKYYGSLMLNSDFLVAQNCFGFMTLIFDHSHDRYLYSQFIKDVFDSTFLRNRAINDDKVWIFPFRMTQPPFYNLSQCSDIV